MCSACLPMLAIADQRVELSIGVAEGGALPVGTSETFGAYTFGSSPPAFDLAPGSHRQRRWPCSRRGSGGETTGRAIVWAAGPEVMLERRAYLGSCSRMGRAVIGPTKGT